jgi:hypothetical protein
MQTYHAGGWTIFLVWVSAISMLVLWVAWRWQAHKMHWIREWRWHTGGGGGFGGGMNDWADINQDADRAEADVAVKER